MNQTSYFIKHPVIAMVLNSLIFLMGALCYFSLPLREYPDVNILTLTVRAAYPNASAELVENSITSNLEDQLSGIEGLETLTSESRQGFAFLELTFQAGTEMNQALVDIHDALNRAKGLLPKEIKEPTVEKKGKSTGIPFMAVGLESTSMDFGELTHYVNLNLKNAFRSIKGVSSADLWGQPYTIEITLDPKKMYDFGVNGDDVFKALEEKKLSLPAGRFQNKIPVTLNVELKSVEDYENLLIKEKQEGEEISVSQKPAILLKSIAEVSLKTDTRNARVRVNGAPGLILSIQRTGDANPLEVSNLVREKVKDLEKILPQGLKIKVIEDQADFVRASLYNIRSTLIEAIVFVLVIVFVFLGNVRSTFIPLLTIPISLIGGFIFLKIFGFSINIMTLLAMVLAVGLVVDDAIIVLENIARHVEGGLSSFEASVKGAKEIGPAIVAMTLTLTSVYAPIAFIQGAIGQIFIEFAVALAGAVLLSGFVALTLSPLMCAKALKGGGHHVWPSVEGFLNHLSTSYGRTLHRTLHHSAVVIFGSVVIFGAMIFFFKNLPQEIVPKEDRGFIGVYVPPLVGKDMDAMEQKLLEINSKIGVLPEEQDRMIFMGDWGGNIAVALKPKSERKRSVEDILAVLRPVMMEIPSTAAWPWSLDSGLPGLDEVFLGGDVSLVISTVGTYQSLFEEMEALKADLEKEKLFEAVRHDLKLDLLGLVVNVDNNLLSKLKLKHEQISKMIEIFFSGDSSLSFQKDGILYPITLQGAKNPWTLDELYVTNEEGKHISLGAVAQLDFKARPRELFHYNQMRSTILSVELLPGEKIESGMEKLLKKAQEQLPSTYKKTWTGAAKMYKESSMTMVLLFGLALIFIYAILSMQFESFVDPLIILTTVPLACAGALGAAWIFHQSLNIYSQVGLITLVGLITKHGILIVEFTNQLQKQGLPLLEAVKQAASLRLRPILMTTAAMLCGAIPLVLSQGEGSECHVAIGWILVGGLSVGTFLTLFILPTVCYLIKSLREPLREGRF